MEEKSLVTILTATRNRASLIHRCIESIQKQTYRNYEHIIIDGNSEDDTEEVVKSYNDSHIKYIKLSEYGPEVQMRAGFEASRGSLIAFLDDDDEYLPEKIEKQVAAIEHLPVDYGMVYCWMTYYRNDDPNTPIKIHSPKYHGWVKDVAVAENRISGTPTLLVRREIIEKIGGVYQDSHCGLPGADVHLATRICSVCKVECMPESLVKVYVAHGKKRLSDTVDKEFFRNSIRFHQCFLDDYPEVFVKNPKRSNYHLYYLTRFYFKLGDYKNGFVSFGKLLRTCPSFIQLRNVLAALLLRK
jgi:glycosyltransferase involved in cell wall biosynthesis